jgi:hypothetical protein
MQYLFDSDGNHIANFANGELYARTGYNIGHYLPAQRIFIDMRGRYLGEIVRNNRLLYNVSSRYRQTTFSANATRSSIGNYGNPGKQNNIGRLMGYENVPKSRLRP